MKSVPKPKKSANQSNYFGANIFDQMPEQGTWHQERKKAILAKYPQVKELCKPDPITFPVTLVLLTGHLTVSYLISKYDAPWWAVVAVSWVLGSWFCFMLQACGHEGVHGSVFTSPLLNKIQGYIGFMSLWIAPFETFWHPEHLHHHSIVVDKVLRFGHQRSPFLVKAFLPLFAPFLVQFWLAIQAAVLFVTCCVSLVLYVIGMKSNPLPQSFALRPFGSFPSMISWDYMLLYLVSTTFWYTWFMTFGIKSVAYLIIGSAFSNGFHPLGMRNVQEHLVKKTNQPTYSLYYPDSLTWLHALISLNINHHIEHHDFSNIPWTNLPKLRRIAPEFYNNMNNYNSYTQVWKEFVFDEGIPPAAYFEEIFPSGSSTSDSTADKKKAQ